MRINSYDTLNLRNDAEFATEIYPDVFWVPISILGKTRFINADMIALRGKTVTEIKKTLTNPYEVIQFLQCNNFEICMDSVINNNDGIIWQEHTSGRKALALNRGCCSSMSGLLTYALDDFFEQVGTMCMIANSGVGHTVNYIYQGGNYYFIDLYAQVLEGAINIPKETGIKSDFAKTKYTTGICLKTNAKNKFINFFERYNKLKKREFLFFSYNSEKCPPVSIMANAVEMSAKIVLPRNFGIEVFPYSGEKIAYRFENYCSYMGGKI